MDVILRPAGLRGSCSIMTTPRRSRCLYGRILFAYLFLQRLAGLSRKLDLPPDDSGPTLHDGLLRVNVFPWRQPRDDR